MDWGLTIGVASLFMGTVSMIFAIKAIIASEALKNSTHQIQYVYPDMDTPEGSESFAELDKKTRMNLENEDDIFHDEADFLEDVAAQYKP